MSQRDEYVGKMKAQLDHWNAEMAKWEAKAGEAQAGARAEYERHLKTLRDQREQAAYQLNLLQSAAGSAWVDMARGVDEAWERMREAFEKAASHFPRK
jgi:hypothetical protein